MKRLFVVTTLVAALTLGTTTSVLAEENNTSLTSENKELSESKFKNILNDPAQVFDFKISEAKYVIKNTDTEYLLLAATSEEAKGLYSIKTFAYDGVNNKVLELEEEFVLGSSQSSWVSGTLEEYSNNSNKLRYTVKSESVDKFEIKDIIFEKNEINDETVKEGVLSKDKLPSANVKDISWKTLELKKDVVDKENEQTSTVSDSSINSDASKNQSLEKGIVVERKENKKSKLDINAIAGGDLTSLVGGIYADTIIKNNTNINIVSNGAELEIGSIKKEGNVAIIESRITAKAPIVEDIGEIPVDRAPIYHYVVPAGEKSPVEVENDDITRDRVITQIHANKEVSYLDNDR